MVTEEYLKNNGFEKTKVTNGYENYYVKEIGEQQIMFLRKQGSLSVRYRGCLPYILINGCVWNEHQIETVIELFVQSDNEEQA